MANKIVKSLFSSKTRVKLLELFFTNQEEDYYVREITREIDEQINSVRRELDNLQKIGVVKKSGKSNKLFYRLNPKFKYFKPLAMMFDRDLKSEDMSAVTVSEPEKTKVASAKSKTALIKQQPSADKVSAETATEVEPTTELVAEQEAEPIEDTVEMPVAEEKTESIETDPDHKLATWQTRIAKISPISELVVLAGQLVRESVSQVDMLIVGDNKNGQLSKWAAGVETEIGTGLNYTILDYQDFFYRLSVKDKFLTDILDAEHVVLLDKSNSLENYKK